MLYSALLTAFAGAASAHSWIEQMSIIGSNGSFTGAYGYPRGYIARTDPGFNGFSDMYLLPPTASGRAQVDSTDLLCHPAQRSANQTNNYPALKVGPGSSFAMKYFENGHVSLPQNQKGKPESGGPVFVYGTTQPKPDEKLTDVLQWTADGSGGDKRGRLLTAQNFDDGRCYQINGGAISTQRQKQFPNPVAGQPNSQHEQWCETDVTLPADVKTGTYTIYWVWDWPTAAGQDPGLPTGKDEFYTTCADIEVEAQEPTGPIANQLPQQDPQMNAVPSYKTRTAVIKTPNGLGSASNSSESTPPATPAAPAPAPAASSPPASAGTVNPAEPTMAVFKLNPTAPVAASSPTLPTSAALLAAGTNVPAGGAVKDGMQTLTATLKLVATLAPGQQGLVANGPFEFTFVRDNAAPTATLNRRSAKFRNI